MKLVGGSCNEVAITPAVLRAAAADVVKRHRLPGRNCGDIREWPSRIKARFRLSLALSSTSAKSFDGVNTDAVFDGIENVALCGDSRTPDLRIKKSRDGTTCVGNEGAQYSEWLWRLAEVELVLSKEQREAVIEFIEWQVERGRSGDNAC
jgi:hypothetical protein